MAEKYIYVNGKKIYVSDEIYKAYKKQKNKEQYMQRMDRKLGIRSLEEQGIDLQALADESVDIEKIIETKMRLEDLYRALEKLNEEEREIIHSIYFEDKTLQDIAIRHDTHPMKISRLRDTILKKLRKFLDR